MFRSSKRVPSRTTPDFVRQRQRKHSLLINDQRQTNRQYAHIRRYLLRREDLPWKGTVFQSPTMLKDVEVEVTMPELETSKHPLLERAAERDKGDIR